MRASPLLAASLLLAAAFAGCLAGEPGGELGPATAAGMLPQVRCDPAGTGSSLASACNPLVSSGTARAAEPHVAFNPVNPDHLVAGAADYGNPLGGPWCGAYVSEDGGATWERNLLPGYPGDTRPPIGKPAVDNLYGFGYCGDSVIQFAPDGKTVYYAGIAFHPPPAYNVALFVARSTDGGHTWPSVEILNHGASTVIFNDKEWLVVDPETGTLYLTWTLFRFMPVPVPVEPPGLESQGPIMFTRSTDDGLNWDPPTTLSRVPGNQGSVPVVLPDGAVGVQWIEYGDAGPQMVFRRSNDQGATWSDLVVVGSATSLPGTLPNSNFRVPTLPALAVDLSNASTRGFLYSVWHDYGRENADVLLSVSEDGGATWSPAAPVHPLDNATDQFFPWVVVDGRGLVHVAYLDRSEDPENRRYHAAVATSADGGRSFTVARVSDVPSDPLAGDSTSATGAAQTTAFIGDYVGLAASSDGRVAFLWPDLRNQEPGARPVDLYAARLGPVP